MSEPRASRPTPDWLGGKELLSWTWAEEKLTAERNYWLVSLRRDGFPQARPLWGVWLDGLLYLSVGHAGLQRAQERQGAGREVTVHVDSAVDVVIVEGAIFRVAGSYGPKQQEIVDPVGGIDALRDAGRLYTKKYEYGSDFLNFAVVPRLAYGWRDEEVKTATKWTFP